MKNKTHACLVLLGIFFISLQPANSQGKYYSYDGYYTEPKILFEAGLHAGMMNCMVDVGGSRNGRFGSLTFKNTNLTGGAYASATYEDGLAIRLEYNFGKIEAADSSLKGASNSNAQGRFARNLSFSSPIRELSITAEFHPLHFIYNYQQNPPKLSPYLMGGVGWLTFNPQANLNGNLVNLQPLRLEGQGFREYPDRKMYRLHAVSYPLGIGLRYELSRLVNVRVEISRRNTSTDYLDDVSEKRYVDPSLFEKYLSPQEAALAVQLFDRGNLAHSEGSRVVQRGNPNQNDVFWTTVVKVGIALNRRPVQ